MSDTITDAPESITVNDQSEVIELVQSSPQIQPRAFWYEVIFPDGKKKVTMIATSSSGARFGMNHNFPGLECRYIDSCDIIAQVNGEMIIDV